jgi:WD40 repeat protein
LSEQIVVTGGADALVTVWEFERRKSKTSYPHLRYMKSCFGHTDRITRVAISRAYNIIVSGSADETCIIWDLNEFDMVQQLTGFDAPVSHVLLHPKSGDIVVSAGSGVFVFTVNGDLVAHAETHDEHGCKEITALEIAKTQEWQKENLIVTGHDNGLIRLWNLVFNVEKKMWELVCRGLLKTHQNAVTSLSLDASQCKLFSGDKNGSLMLWVVPEEKTTNRLGLPEDKNIGRTATLEDPS